MHKKLNDFHKKSTRLKTFSPKTKEKEDLKESFRPCYQDKYNKEKNGLNRNGKKKFDYKKLKLTEDYQCESEEEEEEEEQTSKISDKKVNLKNHKKLIWENLKD